MGVELDDELLAGATFAPMNTAKHAVAVGRFGGQFGLERRVAKEDHAGRVGFMRRYSLLHPLWMAFYDGAIYEDVARNWRNRTFLYLLLLLALTWIPFTIQTQNQVDEWISREAPVLY